MAFIDTIAPAEASGELRQVYDAVEKNRGQVGEVLQLHSLNPGSLTNHLDLYMTVMFGKSPLRRKVREMLAVVVSCANRCQYCQTHHGAALNHFWKDDERVARLKVDFRDADLDAAELALAEYAWQLTREPSSVTADSTDHLRKAGWNDRAILDAAMVISYFNFVNRMVLGLGANVESDGGAGYRYD